MSELRKRQEIVAAVVDACTGVFGEEVAVTEVSTGASGPRPGWYMNLKPGVGQVLEIDIFLEVLPEDAPNTPVIWPTLIEAMGFNGVYATVVDFIAMVQDGKAVACTTFLCTTTRPSGDLN